MNRSVVSFLSIELTPKQMWSKYSNFNQNQNNMKKDFENPTEEQLK